MIGKGLLFSTIKTSLSLDLKGGVRMQNQVAKFLTFTVLVAGLAFLHAAGCSSGNGTRPTSVGGATGSGGSISGAGGGGGDCSVAACPAPGILDCSNAVKPAMATIVDWSPCTWRNTAGHFGLCPITGSVYPYQGGMAADGTPSSSTNSPDLTAQNLHWMATVQPNGYAGFGLQFDACTDVSTFSGVQFTLSGTTGGCDLQLQFATFSQRPTTQSTLPGGCDPDAGSCYGYPAATMLAGPTDATAAPITIQIPFSGVTNWSTDNAKQIVGLQWQLGTPSGATTACTADLRLDDVAFMP
jgi:hypothetical protein